MRLLSNLNINMKMEEPLAPFTSFKVGGNAKFYAKPATLTDLLYILKYHTLYTINDNSFYVQRVLL